MSTILTLIVGLVGGWYIHKFVPDLVERFKKWREAAKDRIKED